MPKESVNAIDALVGQKVRKRRLEMGMTLEGLGQQVGVGSAQIEKYETGQDRVSASGLHSIAEVLRVEIGFFFKGFEGAEVTTRPQGASRRPAPKPEADKSILRLVASFRTLTPAQQDALLAMVVAISDANKARSRTGSLTMHSDGDRFAGR